MTHLPFNCSTSLDLNNLVDALFSMSPLASKMYDRLVVVAVKNLACRISLKGGWDLQNWTSWAALVTPLTESIKEIGYGVNKVHHSYSALPLRHF